MNKEIKEKWITALESGEYLKGDNALRVDNTYCCLGVLCDLYRKENNKVEWKKASGPNIVKLNNVSRCDVFGMGGIDDSWGVLPEIVKNWAELEENNPQVYNSKNLATINDRNKTFKEVIEAIKTCL